MFYGGMKVNIVLQKLPRCAATFPFVKGKPSCHHACLQILRHSFSSSILPTRLRFVHHPTRISSSCSSTIHLSFFLRLFHIIDNAMQCFREFIEPMSSQSSQLCDASGSPTQERQWRKNSPPSFPYLKGVKIPCE